MVQWLSRISFFMIGLFFADTLVAQPQTGGYAGDDYKDAKSHEKFRKRRNTVAAWQINQLKKGALIVKLKTNHLLINELTKRGEEAQAEKVRLERAGMNINMMKAFRDHYKFSKVYFIYSNSSDSLLNGAMKGIFIDTSLKINPSISMSEKFYLIAEPDFVYNSSIGFVPEDSAKSVTERGNPSASELPIVLKNKYGHQLKNPFPYTTSKFVFTKNVPTAEIMINGVPQIFTVRVFDDFNQNDKSGNYTYKGTKIELSIPRGMTYEVLSEHVKELNADLENFYRGNGGFSENNKNYEDSKPFFY